MVLPNQPGFDWGRVERLPEVASVSTFAVDYTLTYQGLPADVGGFPPANDTVLRSIEKPVVLQGRVFDPRGIGEAVVTPMFVADHHRGVGDSVILHLPTPREWETGRGSGPGGSFTGPRLRLRIVGVIRSPWFSDSPGSDGAILMSPAVAARYPLSVVGNPHNQFSFVNALVRLRGGEAAIPGLRRDIARLTGRHDIDIWDLPRQYADAQRQIAFEARCLVALAAAFAVAVSPWFPMGDAALIEPSPGLSANWAVIGPAVALITMLVAGGRRWPGGPRSSRAAGRCRSGGRRPRPRRPAPGSRSRSWSGRGSRWSRAAARRPCQCGPLRSGRWPGCSGS